MLQKTKKLIDNIGVKNNYTSFRDQCFVTISPAIDKYIVLLKKQFVNETKKIIPYI